MRKNKYLLLSMLFIGFCGSAQNYEADINKITKDGLHKIELDTKLRSAAEDNFKYIRILDSKGEEVPYVLRSYKNKFLSTFNPIEISSIEVLKDSVTSILFENLESKIQEKLTLKIANTKIGKMYSVHGSNDGSTWYGLMSEAGFSNLSSKTATFVERTIWFPRNTYKYIRIDFDDRRSPPINIIGAGDYSSTYFTKLPVEIKDFRYDISQNKEGNKTIINFSSKRTHSIDVISFEIGTNYFQRDAKVYINYDETQQIGGLKIRYYQLSSRKFNSFEIQYLNNRKFTIVIDDQDNPPLDIESIKLFQRPVYLVADLKENEKYRVKIDTALDFPYYDLRNFVNDDTVIVEEASIGELKYLNGETPYEEDESFFKSDYFLWIATIVGILMVLIFTKSLIRDVNNKS